MKRLFTRLVLVLLMACAVSVPAARAQSLLFDYVGFDYEFPDLNPSVFGDIGDGYQGVGEVGSLFFPLVSDQTNYQYTYFFDGLTATSRSTVGPFIIVNYAGPGTLTIYEDSRSSGTPADYGTNPPSVVAPPTFIDGTAILVGKLTNFQYVFNTTSNTGSFEADFEAVGGTQLGSFPLNQRLGWTFAGTSGNSVTVPTGYDHQVDGQTFLNPPTSTHSGTWGGIKARYR
jgi:hypothetical protein